MIDSIVNVQAVSRLVCHSNGSRTLEDDDLGIDMNSEAESALNCHTRSCIEMKERIQESKNQRWDTALFSKAWKPFAISRSARHP